MTLRFVTSAVVAAALATVPGTVWLSGSVSAQPAVSENFSGAPEDIIAARKDLMLEMQRLMLPVDAATADAAIDTSQLKSAGTSLAAMLRASAHLFPASTNLYDESAAQPQITSALPALWEDFATFTAMARASAEAAAQLSSSDGAASIRQHAAQLRASCDACHASFLIPYEPLSVEDEDSDLDFDALFDSFE